MWLAQQENFDWNAVEAFQVPENPHVSDALTKGEMTALKVFVKKEQQLYILSK